MPKNRDASDEPAVTESPDDRSDAKINTLQILAATGAATTGAIVANAMGIYGTVIGVAVFSVISSLGTVLLLQSLNRTRDRLRKAVRRIEAAAPPETGDASATGAQRTAAESLSVTSEPAAVGDSTATSPIPTIRPAAGSITAGDAHGPTSVTAARRRMAWKPMVLTSVIVFALTIGVLTGIALMSGQSPGAFYGRPPTESMDPQPDTDEVEPGGQQDFESTESPASESPDSPSPSEESEPSEPTATPSSPGPTDQSPEPGGTSEPEPEPEPDPEDPAAGQ